jgi:Cu/Zn superoxide dismutase
LIGKPLAFGLRLLSVALFLLVVLSGLLGDQEVSTNFAPTFVWVVWWVGLSFIVAFVGNVWPIVNPWKVLFEWADGLTRRLRGGKGLELREPYPASWGVWPAFLLYALFVWVEIVFEGSATPSNIALLALLYTIPTWSGMAVFGKEAWLQRGDAFSVFFNLLAKFAPTEVRVTNPEVCRDCGSACRVVKGGCVNCYECFAKAPPEDRALNIRPLAVGLGSADRASPSYLIFIIFVLAGVTYDSLLPTPLWAELHDLTSMPRALGLVTVPLCFLTVYLGFVKLSQLFSGRHVRFGRLAETYVYSLVPIAIVYQLAHYLTFLLVQGQAIVPLLSDPFGRGWDVFGTSDYAINYTVLDAGFVWYLQVALIVAGHVIAVYLSHVMSLRLLHTPRLVMRGQLPMLALMILYTVFSLWILSQPVIVAASERKEPDMTVELSDTQGNSIGTAELSEGSTGIEIVIKLRKGQQAIRPGEHGVHLLEKGDITPGFEAAGDHFNPTNDRHGFEDPQGPHAGDLGNISVLADGGAVYGTTNDRVTLSGAKNGLLDEDGSALVITDRPDDYLTDPDGNSGNGVAGGVIEKSIGFPMLVSGIAVLGVLLSIMGTAPWGLLVGRRLLRR